MRQVVRKAVLSALIALHVVAARAVERDDGSGIPRDQSGDVRAPASKSAVVPSLSGWNGLVFFCDVDVSSTSIRNDICERVVANARFLAGSARVPLVVASDIRQLEVQSKTEGKLALYVFVSVLGCVPSQLCAMFASVRAEFQYEELVDLRASTYKRRSSSGALPEAIAPASVPRRLLVDLWRQNYLFTAHEYGQGSARGLADGIDQAMKNFFVDYLAANPDAKR